MTFSALYMSLIHFKKFGIINFLFNDHINDIKWAATCDFQQYGILTSVDSDEHLQPPLQIRNSKRCSVSSLTLIEYSSSDQTEALLVAHTTLLEISSRNSNIYWIIMSKNGNFNGHGVCHQKPIFHI